MSYVVSYFFHFRIHSRIYIGPKISFLQGAHRKIFLEKYGQAYASKEKLYARHRGFIIPKASPLEASYDSLLCKGHIFIQVH